MICSAVDMSVVMEKNFCLSKAADMLLPKSLQNGQGLLPKVHHHVRIVTVLCLCHIHFLLLEKPCFRQFAIWQAVIQLLLSLHSHPLRDGVEHRIPARGRDQMTPSNAVWTIIGDVTGMLAVNFTAVHGAAHHKIIPSPDMICTIAGVRCQRACKVRRDHQADRSSLSFDLLHFLLQGSQGAVQF